VTVRFADCFSISDEYEDSVDLCIVDPPYGGILAAEWDVACYDEVAQFLQIVLKKGATAYVWGGVGTHAHRPFFEWLATVEHDTSLHIHNVITWSKKRAYGTAHNYLFTREECAMIVKGQDRPKTFHVPLLDEKRGYAGYNKKYPAKSEYKRRTNVWTDITEILRGKKHPAEKPVALAEVMIHASSNEGDLILDPMAGSGSTGVAAEKVGGRRCVLIEKDTTQTCFGVRSEQSPAAVACPQDAWEASPDKAVEEGWGLWVSWIGNSHWSAPLNYESRSSYGDGPIATFDSYAAAMRGVVERKRIGATGTYEPRMLPRRIS